MQEAGKRSVEFWSLDAVRKSKFRREYAVLSLKHITDAFMQVMLDCKLTVTRYCGR
jgi:hypothetical protein